MKHNEGVVMFRFLKKKYEEILLYFWHQRMIKEFAETNETLLYMDADEAVKWIDDKIKEGEELKMECKDEEVDSMINSMHETWRRIRIKRMWEIAHKK